MHRRGFLLALVSLQNPHPAASRNSGSPHRSMRIRCLISLGCRRHLESSRPSRSPTPPPPGTPPCPQVRPLAPTAPPESGPRSRPPSESPGCLLLCPSSIRRAGAIPCIRKSAMAGCQTSSRTNYSGCQRSDARQLRGSRNPTQRLIRQGFLGVVPPVHLRGAESPAIPKSHSPQHPSHTPQITRNSLTPLHLQTIADPLPPP